MIIQCKTQEGYDLLCSCLCSFPMGDLKIDIDEDLISKEVREEFERVETGA